MVSRLESNRKSGKIPVESVSAARSIPESTLAISPGETIKVLLVANLLAGFSIEGGRIGLQSSRGLQASISYVEYLLRDDAGVIEQWSEEVVSEGSLPLGKE